MENDAHDDRIKSGAGWIGAIVAMIAGYLTYMYTKNEIWGWVVFVVAGMIAGRLYYFLYRILAVAAVGYIVYRLVT